MSFVFWSKEKRKEGREGRKGKGQVIKKIMGLLCLGETAKDAHNQRKVRN